MSFPRYPEYKKSGVDWLGNVPSHWVIKRTGNYFEERREKVSDKDYQPLSVTKNGVVPQLETAAKSDDGDNRKKVCEGDFVINSRSDRKGSSGISGLAGSVSLINTVLIPRSEIHPNYINHLFRSVSFQEEYYRYGKGIVADLWSTNYSEMRNILLAIPTFEEQILIANFLDQETKKIDSLIVEQEKLIDLLKEKRQALISQAVTKGLDLNVKMKDSDVEWLGKVPEHWEVLKFLRRVKIAEGQVDPTKEPYASMLLIAPNHIESNTGRLFEYETASEQDAVSGKYLCQKGNVVYSKIRPSLRKVCIAPEDCLCSADMYPLEAHSGLINKFLYWFILSEPFSAFAVLESDRVAMPKINRESLNEVFLAIPPLSEQLKMVSFLEQETIKIDNLVELQKFSISLLKERRSALITAAVTGQIDVRNFVRELEAS